MPNSILLVVARVLLAAMFLMSGLSKFADGGMTAGMIAGAGLPAPGVLAILAGIFEVVAGIAVIVGFQTRIAALVLAAFCVFTAFVFHSSAIAMPGFPPEANGMLSMFNQLMMMKNLTIAGGFLALAAAGAGAISLDARRAGQSTSLRATA